MKPTRRIDRRHFAKEASLAFLSGVTVTLTACGGGSSPNPVAATPPTTLPPAASRDEAGEISANHGHKATIAAAMVQSGGALQLDIRGDATHPHLVTVPAEAMRDIKEGKPVEVRSSTNEGHDHTVTFNADVPAPPTRY